MQRTSLIYLAASSAWLCACSGRTTESGGGTGGASPSGGAGGVASTGGSSGGGRSGSGGSSAGAGGISGTGGGSNGGGGGHALPSGFVFSPYKDVGVNMNWNTNVVSTAVSGVQTPLSSDLRAHGGTAITLAFATGECGTENWAGLPGATMAAANLSQLTSAGVDYLISTGGAAGSFTCASDAAFRVFVDRWVSPHLIGVDFDIEAGQSQAVIQALIQRIKAGHVGYPTLRFSLTLATLANNSGASAAAPLGAAVPDSLNVYGDQTMQAVASIIGADWPSYLTVNLMTMDYGSPSPGVCVVRSGLCDMGQSALQAAYNLHDKWGVPYANIELTPMIGGNDVTDEHFILADVDTLTTFARAFGLAGLHNWSYDRDTDCPRGSAMSTCNSLGGAGNYGFLARFLAGL